MRERIHGTYDTWDRFLDYYFMRDSNGGTEATQYQFSNGTNYKSFNLKNPKISDKNIDCYDTQYGPTDGQISDDFIKGSIMERVGFGRFVVGGNSAPNDKTFKKSEDQLKVQWEIPFVENKDDLPCSINCFLPGSLALKSLQMVTKNGHEEKPKVSSILSRLAIRNLEIVYEVPSDETSIVKEIKVEVDASANIVAYFGAAERFKGLSNNIGHSIVSENLINLRDQHRDWGPSMTEPLRGQGLINVEGINSKTESHTRHRRGVQK